MTGSIKVKQKPYHISMWALLWFMVALDGIGLALLGLTLYIRVRRQEARDKDRMTFELTFPTGMSHETAARLFTALSGLFKPIRMSSGMWGRPRIVFEVLASSSGLHHVLSFPPQLGNTVRGHLRGVIPNLGITECADYSREWTYATELDTSNVNADPELIPVLLSSLRELSDQEAVLIQFVMTPTGIVATEDSQDVFWGVGRVAVAAKSTVRAKALLVRAQAAYGSLRVWALPGVLEGEQTQVVNRKASPTPRLDWPALVPKSFRLPQAGDVLGPLWTSVLSPRTLAVVCGLPINSPQIPGLVMSKGRRFAPEPIIPTEGRRLAQGNYVGAERPLALSPEDRLKHVYIVAPTGGGKTSLLENMILDDINEGNGVALFDLKSDLVQRLLGMMPNEHADRLVLFDPTDTEHPVGFNILNGSDPHKTTGDVLKVLDNLYELSGSAPRAYDVLHSTLLTLAMTGYTLCEVSIILEPGPRGRRFRNQVVSQIQDYELKNYWAWYDSQTAKEQADVAAPITRRLRSLLLYPSLRRSLGQIDSGFGMSDLLREKKILLVPLGGNIPNDVRPLIGVLLLTQLWNAVEMRPIDERENFYLYIDEFEDLMNLPLPIGEMFAKARGYKLGMTIAHQHTYQMSASMRHDVFANARSKLAFNVDAEDAKLLAPQFGALVEPTDLTGLGEFEVMTRLAVSNQIANPATGVAYPPGVMNKAVAQARTRYLRASSRAQYARPSADVEAELQARWGAKLDASPAANDPELPIGVEDWDPDE